MKDSLTAVSSIDIRAPRERVWSAVTDPNQVKQYFFGAEFQTTWEVGSPVVIRGEWDGKPFEDHGKVLAFEPLKQVKYIIPDSYGTVTYELADSGEGTKLTISQEGSATSEQKEQAEQNWNMILQSVKGMVEGDS